MAPLPVPSTFINASTASCAVVPSTAVVLEAPVEPLRLAAAELDALWELGARRARIASWAVVPVGYRNRFGHPSREVLERYRAAGAEVLRTDRDGAVTRLQRL